MSRIRQLSPVPQNAHQRWLDAGLAALTEGGLEALRIDTIAARIGLTKGSFYHHFENREAYVEALLDRWEHESTLRIIELADAAPTLGAKFERVDLLSEAVDHRLEIALRSLAQHDARIARKLARVDRRRIEYLDGLSRAAGASPEYARFLAELGYFAFVGAQQLHRLPHPAAWHSHLRQLIAAGVESETRREGMRSPTKRKRG